MNAPQHRFGDAPLVRAHRVAAEVVVRSDGDPVRLTRNGGLKKPMGLYFSAKCGRHQPWEARTELKAFYWVEASTNVLAYWAQPHTLKFPMDGKLCRYTPDREDALVGGIVEIVEVKNDFDEKKDPQYTRKLDHARAIYESLGYRFRILTIANIEAEPAFTAVQTIQRYRGVAISPASLECVQDALCTGAVALGQLIEELGGGPLAQATFCAMVVHRVVAIDLSMGLNSDALVSIVPIRPGTSCAIFAPSIGAI